MLRPVGMLAAAGFVGVLLTKLLWMLMLPLFGVVAGMLLLVLKIVFIAALIGVGWWCYSRMTDKPSEA